MIEMIVTIIITLSEKANSYNHIKLLEIGIIVMIRYEKLIDNQMNDWKPN